MSGAFDDRLVVEFLGDGTWILRENFTMRRKAGSITVHRGFRTDFASIPRALWWLYPPTGPWGKAAVIHDCLYRTQDRSRAEADAIFLEGMRLLGVPALRRWVMYLAVRLFGRMAWRGNQAH